MYFFEISPGSHRVSEMRSGVCINDAGVAARMRVDLDSHVFELWQVRVLIGNERY
jgi:hypothetical protein